jgi:hypothetical protein
MTIAANKRVLSGMRPTGQLHLGHYHGVLKNWVQLQHEFECFFFVADWHALTTSYEDTGIIGESVFDIVVDWLSVGINPGEATLFVQSRVPEHAELHLLLSMITPSAGSNACRATRISRRSSRRRISPPTAFSVIRCCSRPTSSSTRPAMCRWGRTRWRTSSCRARWRGASITSTGVSSVSRTRPKPRSRKWARKTPSSI